MSELVKLLLDSEPSLGDTELIDDDDLDMTASALNEEL